MDCKDLFLAAQESLKANTIMSLESDCYRDIASAHSFVEDFKIWNDYIGKKYNNELFTLAIFEYETAIMFTLQSLYKQAFTAMRACLEH